MQMSWFIKGCQKIAQKAYLTNQWRMISGKFAGKLGISQLFSFPINFFLLLKKQYALWDWNNVMNGTQVQAYNKWHARSEIKSG